MITIGAYGHQKLTNLFGIYCANEDIIHCFFYDESIGGSGPNEVISLLNYLLKSLQEKYGKFHQLILWAGNSPAQFKESYLFFYPDHIVRKGEFRRVDLKFLLEGQSFSICDRWFGCIQQFFNTKEKIETPQEWETTLRNSCLNNVKSYWVNLDWIMNYKSFLRMKYVARSEDIEREKFAVRKIAFINFGSGEITDQEENLQLSWHPETPFIRFTMDTKEKPRIVSFLKKKQGVELNAAEHLVPVRLEKKPIRDDVKQDCIKLAQKYLSATAKCFYASLPAGSDQDIDDNDD